jgi:hypothetical protein
MFKDSIRWLLFAAVFFGITSYKACQEGEAHDQSGLCMIDIHLPPPFLGFEYWTTVGIALGALTAGTIIAAGMLATRDDS